MHVNLGDVDEERAERWRAAAKRKRPVAWPLKVWLAEAADKIEAVEAAEAPQPPKGRP